MPVPEPQMHGGDGPALARALGVQVADIVDLSQSLNPVAPDLRGIVSDHLESLRHYPDPDEARRALAKAIGIDPTNILLTNGGAQAIDLVAQEMGGRVTEPEFSLLPRDQDGGRPRWRSNPNNPTGLLAPTGARAEVWDEAYYALATGSWTRGDKGSTVVGSLTKLFACPGLRIGYVMGDCDLISRLERKQVLWSVNSLALAVLPALIELADLAQWSKAVASLRDDLVAVLKNFDMSPEPSDACWVIVFAPDLRRKLARKGVLVRDCTNFGMPGYMRVAVPDEVGLERLERALRSTREPTEQKGA